MTGNDFLFLRLLTFLDTSIAGVTGDGTLVVSSEGTANITVTGLVYGKTASRPVTVTPVVVVETYLQIKNNLSEIAAAGTTAQGTSRTNLGLKTLATKDSLTATDVNAVPLANISLPVGTNLNDITSPGQYIPECDK